MQCPVQGRDGAELLLAWCSRKLDPERAEFIERHLETCGECRRLAEAQRMVWTALDAWDAMAVSEDFDDRLARRIDAERRRGWWERWMRPVLPASLRPALPLAAALVIVVAGALVRSPETFDLEPQGHLELVEIEQAERTLEDLDMLKQLSAAPAALPEKKI